MKNLVVNVFFILIGFTAVGQTQEPLKSVHISYTKNLSSVDSLPVVHPDSIALRLIIPYNSFSGVKELKISCLNEFDELVYSKILVLGSNPLGISDETHKYQRIDPGTISPLINKVIIGVQKKELIKKVVVDAIDNNNVILNSKVNFL